MAKDFAKRAKVLELLRDPEWAGKSTNAIKRAAGVQEYLVRSVAREHGIIRPDVRHYNRRGTETTMSTDAIGHFRPRRVKRQWHREARGAGVDLESLEQLATAIRAADAEHVTAVRRLLADARATATKRGHGNLNRRQLEKAGCLAGLRGFDTLALAMASEHRELFAGYDDPAERLWGLLLAGSPRPMTVERSFEEALNQLATSRAASSGIRSVALDARSDAA